MVDTFTSSAQETGHMTQASPAGSRLESPETCAALQLAVWLAEGTGEPVCCLPDVIGDRVTVLHIERWSRLMTRRQKLTLCRDI